MNLHSKANWVARRWMQIYKLRLIELVHASMQIILNLDPEVISHMLLYIFDASSDFTILGREHIVLLCNYARSRIWNTLVGIDRLIKTSFVMDSVLLGIEAIVVRSVQIWQLDSLSERFQVGAYYFWLSSALLVLLVDWDGNSARLRVWLTKHTLSSNAYWLVLRLF